MPTPVTAFYRAPLFLLVFATKAEMIRALGRLAGYRFGPGRNIAPVPGRGFERRLGGWVIRVRAYADDVADPRAVENNLTYLRRLADGRLRWAEER